MGYIRAPKYDYGKDRCPMRLEKLLNNEMGWKGAPCEFIHPLVMEDLMCNKKQPRLGRMNAPLKMYGMESTLY